MTIADICRAWDRPSYVHGDVPSTHTLTRKFREGDRTPETVGHVLMKYQPYLQRYANRHFPRHLDEAEEAYVDFVLAVVKRPYLFNKDFAKPLRSFVFRCYKHKLLDILKRNHRWTERARRAGERALAICRGRKTEDERVLERCLMMSHKVFISGIDADKALLLGITEGDRSVWSAYWDEGRTEAEIARRLNRSVNAVSTRILKVKAYLREQTRERIRA